MDRKLVSILTLLIASSIALSLAAYLFGVFSFDIKLALWMQGEESPGFTAVMGAVSFFGDSWVPVILVFCAFTACYIRKRRLEAVFVVATLSSMVIAGVLKILVGRPRPESFSLGPSGIFESFNQYAYPSGHVLFFVVFFGFVSFLAYRYINGRMRWTIISSCIAMVILIGPSRIYLGKHWLSDVIGSYVIGTFWLIILVVLYLDVLSRRSKGLDRVLVP